MGRVARVALLAIVLGGGCGRPAPPQHVLLVTVDTLRADRLGVYGSALGLTPNLDRLATTGVRFATAYAAAPFTLASVSALMTGRHPEAIGVLANADRVLPDVPTIATLLRARGWRTGAVVSSVILRRGCGLDAGFDGYDDALGEREPNRDVPERTAPHAGRQRRRVGTRRHPALPARRRPSRPRLVPRRLRRGGALRRRGDRPPPRRVCRACSSARRRRRRDRGPRRGARRERLLVRARRVPERRTGPRPAADARPRRAARRAVGRRVAGRCRPDPARRGGRRDAGAGQADDPTVAYFATLHESSVPRFGVATRDVRFVLSLESDGAREELFAAGGERLDDAATAARMHDILASARRELPSAPRAVRALAPADEERLRALGYVGAE